MAAWTQSELNFLRSKLNKKPIDVYGEFAQKFGSNARTYDAIQKQLKKLRDEVATVRDIDELPSVANTPIDLSGLWNDDDDLLVPDCTSSSASNNDELTRKFHSDRLANREQQARHRAELQTFVDDLVEMSRRLNVRRDHRHFKGDGASLLIVLSDTHCGKKTKYFDMQVFEQRIRSIPEKVRETIYVPDLDEIVVLLVGDIIEGEDIYPTQAHHIDGPVIDQIQIASRTLWAMSVDLHNEFQVPVRFETCPGNHGRISKSADSKSNWDNVVYQTLGLIASSVDNPHIVVNVNMNDFHTFPVKDKVGLLFHHGTKHTGTPAMQIKIAGWLYTKRFDFMCHGHWHQWEVGTQFGKLIMKNGSLPGGDDLSERMGVYDPPRQGYMVVRNNMPINHVGYLEWENVERE